MRNSNKILLVHPLGYSPDSAGRDVSRMANIMPPLGLAGIAAFLDRHEIANHIIDCYAHPDSDALILDYIKEESPGFIGFSCTTSSFLDGIRIAKLAKKALPGISVVFGGPHVSALKDVLMGQFDAMDFIVVGEGEATLTELLKAHGTKDPQDGQDGPDCPDLESIEGLVYRTQDKKVKFTGIRKKLLDLDSLPFPAYEKLAGYPDAYKLPIFNYPRVPNASCISSRGCPYSCSYCDRSVFKRTFRYNSADYLFDHMQYLNKKFNIKHINFYDDQFTFNRARVEAFAKKMVASNLKMTFNCAARAEHLDLELLKLMKAAGCWMISLGIETGDPDLLARHRQNPDLGMLREKIRLIKKAGIRVKALMMMGLPGETEASIKKSRNYLFSLPIDDLNLAKFTPFPGSPIYKQIKAEGKKMGTFNEDWEKMDCMTFLYLPCQMSEKRLEALFTDFYKRHFMRFSVLAGYVAMAWKSPDSWKRFLKDLSGFLSFAKSSKRMGK